MDFLGFELSSVIHLSFNLGHLTSPSVSFFMTNWGKGDSPQEWWAKRSGRAGVVLKNIRATHPLKLCSVHLV